MARVSTFRSVEVTQGYLHVYSIQQYSQDLVDTGGLRTSAILLARRVQGIESFPEHKMLKTLEDLFRILRDPDTGNRMIAPVEAAITLQAVGDAVDSIVKKPSLKALVIINKGRLLAWIHHFYWSKIRRLSDPIHSNKDDQQMFIKNMSATLYAIFFPDYGHELNEIQANYEVVSGLWLAEDAQHPINSIPFASKLLSHFLFVYGTRKDTALVEELVRSAGGDAGKVARVAITNLRRAMKEAPHNRWPITMHFLIVTGLASGRTHEISNSLHEHELFTTISKCIRILTFVPITTGNSVEEHAFMTAFGKYALVFREMILGDADNGTRALRQCIRYGALEGMAQYLIMHDGTEHAPFATAVESTLSFLTPSLGIRTVCIEALDAFKKLPLLVFSRDSPRSPRWKLWRTFVNATMVHSVFAKLVMMENTMNGVIQHACRYVCGLLSCSNLAV